MSARRGGGNERGDRDGEGGRVLTVDATAGAGPVPLEGAAKTSSEATELDSEPQRKWRPNERLLRALAAARKDLKPGEASLFWDWTRTRDEAPAAEAVGSPQGKVIVSDKAAATAYLAPVLITPAAVRPRAATRRIRVRADLDPRQQLTIKVPRAAGSESGATGPAAAPPVRGVVEVAYAGTRGERRRRNGVAVVLGVFVAVMVFFWLRLPAKKQPGPAVAPRGTPAGLPTFPRDPRPLPSLREPVPGPAAPAVSITLPGPGAPRPAPLAVAASAGAAAPPTPATATKSEGAAPSPALPATVRGASPVTATGAADDSFLIRKKGASSP